MSGDELSIAMPSTIAKSPVIFSIDAQEGCPGELFVHQRSEWLLVSADTEERIVHLPSFRTAFVRRLPRFESRKIRIPSALVNTVLLPKTSTFFRARVTAV